MVYIELLNAIEERRSVHNFQPREIDSAILKEIFYYGSYAPSHYMKEPWNVKVYQCKGKNRFVENILASYRRLGMIPDDDGPKALRVAESMRSFLLQIPHHVVIHYEREEDAIRNEEEYSAVCAFIQNAQLAAWEYGVGMLWTVTPYMHDPIFLREIGLDAEKDKIVAVMQVGYPERIPQDKGRTAITEKLQFINN
ncbi:nitroreductase [Virgibacillus xinjiangensis]|uniref:Nitroreductase n=1 Tax=Virgibacillus xinjiangensis TaxID=393090 RepID=A0ABV7CY61_9BACI